MWSSGGKTLKPRAVTDVEPCDTLNTRGQVPQMSQCTADADIDADVSALAIPVKYAVLICHVSNYYIDIQLWTV